MAGYISEIDYDGGAESNFVEVVVPASVDTSAYTLVVYDKDGIIIETYPLGTPVDTIAGKDVFLFDDTTANWVDIHNDGALALVDGNGDVVQFVSFKDAVTAVEGPANGQTATQIGEHSGSNQSLVTSDGGGSYTTTTTSTPGAVPCFGPGTKVATPGGYRPIEGLRPGDRVLTPDSGPVEIVWAGRHDAVLEPGSDRNRPILVRAGALAPGRPHRDLIVSREPAASILSCNGVRRAPRGPARSRDGT